LVLNIIINRSGESSREYENPLFGKNKSNSSLKEAEELDENVSQNEEEKDIHDAEEEKSESDNQSNQMEDHSTQNKEDLREEEVKEELNTADFTLIDDTIQDLNCLLQMFGDHLAYLSQIKDESCAILTQEISAGDDSKHYDLT
jgi:hypothetical protein